MIANIEKVYKAALRLSNLQSPEKMFELIVREAMSLVNAAHGTIFVEVNGKLVRVYASDSFFYTIEPRKDGFTHKVFTSRKPRILNRSEIKKIHPEIKKTDTRSDIIIPLSYEKKSIGVLSIMSKEKKYFSEKELNVLKLFGPLAALAIKNAQFYEETLTALETRDLFIAMASHELKTPVTTINVYSQLIKRKIMNNQPLQSKLVDPLLNEVTRLTKLINELLQVNQIKVGELNYEWKECILKEILNRAIQDFTVTHKTYKIKYIDTLSKKNSIVWGDYDKVLQVIINILNNAAKFSSKNSTIKISSQIVKRYIEVTVEDSGKGISESDTHKIFDRFYRGSGSHNEGMGLGLYLTKKIIDEHKGNIKIDSKLNQGTKVTLQIPRYGK